MAALFSRGLGSARVHCNALSAGNALCAVQVMHCVQCSAVLCNAVQCSAVKRSALLFRSVHNIPTLVH